MQKRNRTPFYFLFLIFFTISLKSYATSLNEYEVKAIFLFNFSKFVDWPDIAFDNVNAPLVIGVLGEDPFGNTLDEVVRDKTVHGRQVTVARFATLDNLRTCHILFISNSEQENFLHIRSKLQGLPVLSIGETPDFARSGGGIGFVLQQNKVRFEINADEIQEHGLKVSSQLLTLASTIIQKKVKE